MAAADSTTPSTAPLFPQLSGGGRRLAPQEVARHQKARLQGAMVEAVARHGYAGTTLRELVALAGVSKSTFYQHFASKEACFLATFDEIISQLSERVGEAYRQPGDFRERLLCSLGVFLEMAVDEPAAASLVAVESLTLGAAGVAHRERASQGFELLIQQSFDHSPAPRQMSATTVRAVVGGIRGVVYRRLRAGQGKELRNLTGLLVEWALGYQQPDSEQVQRATAVAALPGKGGTREPAAADDGAPGWDEPPDSKRSRRELGQRERIVRAAARVVVEQGYGSLSIPAISAAAGTSNQTFYEHFANKRDCFLAAFEILAGEALRATMAVYDDAADEPEAAGASMRAMLEHIADNELFARLAFFELSTAGPVALDRADQVMDGFTALIDRGPGAGEPDGKVPPVILEAIGSGIWAVIQHEIWHGRREQLPQLAPELVTLAQAPRSRLIGR